MQVIRKWIAIPGICLVLLTLVLSAAPARLSVSNREAVIEGATPGMRVTLFDGETPIGSATVDRAGRARFGELHLTPGDHVLRVTDWGTGWGLGDPVHTSVDAPRAKGSTPTTVTLSSSANPSPFGQPLTLRAVVTPSSATGMVTFYDGTTVLGIGTLTAGSASLTTIMPEFGTRPFHAYYGGSPVYGSSTSPSLSQTVRVEAQNGFQTAAQFTKLNDSPSIAIGDFNGDGRPDLAMVNTDNAAVSIMLADPNPPPTPGRIAGIAFQAPVDYFTGNVPLSIAAGDFNGDGILDLAAANFADKNVSILLGNGDGTFGNATAYAIGFAPVKLTVADFDGDGDIDLAVIGQDVSAVSILLGNGDGTFQLSGTSPAGPTPGCMKAADFNGDGIADLAVSNGKTTVSVLLGKGDGSFLSPVSYHADNSCLAVADVNGDGNVDLVLSTRASDHIEVLFGGGDGTFQLPVQVYVGLPVGTVMVGDFNGDGTADLAITGSTDTNVVAVFLGTRGGTFVPAANYGISSAAEASAVGDLNGDGRSDLVMTIGGGYAILLGIPTYANSSVSLANTPNPSTLGRPVTLTARVTPQSATGSVTFYDDTAVLGTQPLSAGVASFTTTLLPSGARKLKAHYSGDVVFAGSDSLSAAETIVALPEDGLQAPLTQSIGLNLHALAAGDFNGDGIPDLAIIETSLNQLFILLGQGDGSFRSAGRFGAGPGLSSVAVGDFNGDGKPDLAVTAMQQTGPGTGTQEFGVNVLLGNGDGTFQTSMGFDTGNRPFSVVVADFNGDGKPDLAVANEADNTVSILLGNGDGTFRSLLYQSGVPSVTLKNGTVVDPTSLTVGDFNGDGIPDLLVVGRYVLVSLGNGDGTFRPGFIPNTGPVYSVAVGDFNGDGKLDFVVSGFDAATNTQRLFTVYLGNGDGTFAGKDGLVPGGDLRQMRVGDFNGDDVPDLAFIDNSTKQIGTFLGNGQDGTFRTGATYPTLATSMAVADFNRDGRYDFAVFDEPGNILSILLGNPAPPTQVTLQTTPPHLAISVDGGIPVMTPVTLSLAQGLHTLAAPSPQAGLVGQRYVFGNWSDGGSASHQIAVPAAPITYTATFGTQFLLTTSVAPAGAGTISVTSKSPPLDGYYNPGTGVTVTASPAAGYSFSGFSGALTGTVNPQFLSMTAPATVSASFTANPPVQNPTIFGAVANKTTQGSTTTLTLVLSNTGAGPAQLASLTSLTAGVLTGTGSVSVVAPVLPYSAGALPPGGAASVTVQLTITGAVSRVRLLFGGTMQNSLGEPLMFSGAAQVPIP